MSSSFMATSTAGSNYQSCPAGTHPATAIGVLHLGTHWETYKGQDARKVVIMAIVFEIEYEEGSNLKRTWMCRSFNVGLDKQGKMVLGDKSNLKKMLAGWRGKGYAEGEQIDISAVLNRDCLVGVVHDIKEEKTYARIDSVSMLPRGVAPLKPTRNIGLYSVDSGEPAPQEKSGEPEWMPRIYGETFADLVGRCLERGGSGQRASGSKNSSPPGPSGHNGSEIPF